MNKIYPSLILLILLVIAGCSDSKTEPNDVSIDALYGNWLSTCTDFGGGRKNQIFANPKSNGDLDMVMLTWANDGCDGPYTLSDFDGNPLIGPETLNTFEEEDVDGIPENFFVLKTTSTESDEVTYGIFHITDDRLDILNEFTSNHDTWEEWLDETDVAGFVDDPEDYEPTTKDILHFEPGEMPDPLAPLYGNWLSDCVDLGGGSRNQIYAEYSATTSKVALLVWDTLGCTGNYALADLDGDPIDEPVHVQDLEHSPVLGAPMGVFVPKVTTLEDDSVSYPVIQLLPGDEFYELVGFTSTYDTWEEWLLAPDVEEFINDPAIYEPMLPRIKFHFTKSDLPD